MEWIDRDFQIKMSAALFHLIKKNGIDGIFVGYSFISRVMDTISFASYILISTIAKMSFQILVQCCQKTLFSWNWETLLESSQPKLEAFFSKLINLERDWVKKVQFNYKLFSHRQVNPKRSFTFGPNRITWETVRFGYTSVKL